MGTELGNETRLLSGMRVRSKVAGIQVVRNETINIAECKKWAKKWNKITEIE